MSSKHAYDHAAETARRASAATTRDDRELIRMATLAASSHNTQPWTFSVGPDGITIRADPARRCPAVDPDDAHLYRSLGCAAENMVHAASTQGIAAAVVVDGDRREVTVNLSARTDAPPSDLAAAILTRQCTRAEFDGEPVDASDLATLERAGTLGTARCLMITDTERLGEIGRLVTRGNLAQLSDPAFRRELVSWVRFNPTVALATGDGLAGRATGQPAIPTWLGTGLQRLILKADKQAALDATRLASSAGVALLLAPGDGIVEWIDAGRAYQRFALQAEALDIRTAFINQPIEVAALRPTLESSMGLDGERAQLAVRFGHGAKVPYSLRRPLDEVIAPRPT